ncbi:MAG: hypothetical protein ACSLEN_04855 [Candidatus Malihini olakiniferum]
MAVSECARWCIVVRTGISELIAVSLCSNWDKLSGVDSHTSLSAKVIQCIANEIQTMANSGLYFGEILSNQREFVFVYI